MHPALVLEVFLDLQFERGDVGEDVGVCDHYALGLGGGTGGEDDLERVCGCDFGGGVGCGRVCGQCLGEILQREGWD